MTRLPIYEGSYGDELSAYHPTFESMKGPSGVDRRHTAENFSAAPIDEADVAYEGLAACIDASDFSSPDFRDDVASQLPVWNIDVKRV